MNSNTSFRPDWASAPGETIADILAERQIGVIEFAGKLGQTVEAVRDLLQGRSTITLGTARSLHRVLGASVEFWMSRDLQYREDVVQLNATSKEWVAQLPVGDMIKFGWLGSVPHPSDELEACLRFFGVDSVREWREAYASIQEAIAFRTSPSFDSRPGAVAAWLRQGELQGMASECAPWNAAGFQASLPKIRSLTRRKDPRVFVPKLREYCAEHGVAVAVVRSPTGCRASGATRFLSTGRALLLLSFRYLTDDHFWFTFFHESGHLLLHGEQELFLEGADTQLAAKEQEANEFAARVLVPDEFQTTLQVLPSNWREVVRFAMQVGVSPGVIVGQMQRHGRIRRNHLNRLKRRYRWQE